MEELRVRIKQWENSFQERYHRKPKEEDINDKPDILSLYRRYQKLEKRVESEDTSRTRCSSTSSRIRGRSISNNCIKDVVYQEVANHVRKPSPEPRKKPKPRRTSSLGGSFSGAAPHASLVIRPVVANTNVSLVFERPRTPPGEPLLEAHDEPSIFILPAESSNEDFDENTTPAKRKKPPTSRKRPAKRDNNVRLDLNKKYTKKAKTKSLDRIVKNKWVPRAQWIRQQQVAESEKRNDEAYEELLEPENVDIEVPPTLEFEEVNQTALLKVLSDHFHYNSFREGQEQAIINVVKGISTLLVVPTGWGKSMCYQIPALITAGLTLVVSPLLSLIQDQLESLPPSLPGAQWTSSQSFQEVQDTLKAIRESRIKILFVSPERLFASGFLSAMAGIKLSCLVVDEGHLISQWSHNFRPCYIRIHRVLKKLKVSCVLALTATATVQTRESICNQLGIAADNVICPHIPRSNLKLTVSQDHSPREALVPLLRSQNFEYLDSIIIYVSTKAAADQIANNLKVQGFERVASYHAGKRMDDRRSIQEQFMANELRIVVATVAFGMGLDKQDVRAVIHVNIPRSLEAYVQEVGRAGRDGLPAYCHAFFNQEDISRYRSQVHSDGLDACTIKSLLEKFVFRDSGKHLCVAVSKLASKWDVRTPVVETILVRLEALGYITILANMHGRCSVSFHESLPEKLAEKCNLIKWIIRQLSCRQGRYYVNLDDAANALSAPITAVYRQLLDLRRQGEVKLEWKDWGFCAERKKAISGEEIDDVVTDVFSYCVSQELCQQRKVDVIGQVMKAVSQDRFTDCDPEADTFLHKALDMYFRDASDVELLEQSENMLPEEDRLETILNSPVPTFLEQDVRVMIDAYQSELQTPRQVARILHGIASPMFPRSRWFKTTWWRKHMYYPFMDTLKIATDVMNSISEI